MYEVVEMSAVIDGDDAVEHDNDELVILLRTLMCRCARWTRRRRCWRWWTGTGTG